MKRPVAFVVISTLLVWMGTVCAQIITGTISFGQIAGTLNLAAQVTGILPPANGGAGNMINAPMWARNFGNGEDSTGPASGTISGEHHYTTWTCTGAIVSGNATGGLVIRATGAVNLNTGCSIKTFNTTNQVNGDLGGAGGSGGSGAGSSTASLATHGVNNITQAVSTNYLLSAPAALASAAPGNAGGVIAVANQQQMEEIGYPYRPTGGSDGTAGGSTGGGGGAQGQPIIIIAPSITIASGVTLDASGNEGTDSAANSTGAGGGGGGSVIWLVTLPGGFTDNGAIYNFGGGPGGNCQTPSINALGGGCTVAGGCGTGAVFTITGLTAGGLDASKITITNAGSGYQVAPTCKVNAGGSGLIGSPACHFTLTGNTIGSVVIDTPGSGGVLTNFTTCNIGGYGANGWGWQPTIQ